MNYTLNQLQIFLKVVQTTSITKAAEELNLTQPAVSIQVKNFQAQFEIPLLEIIGKKIYITDFGKEIALSAENILEQVYAINYKTMAFKDQLVGRLKVSIVSTGKYVLPYFLSDFLKLNPGIELTIDVTNREKVSKSLEANEVDFSLVPDLPDIEHYAFIDILQTTTHHNFVLHYSPSRTMLLFTTNVHAKGFIKNDCLEAFFKRNMINKLVGFIVLKFECSVCFACCDGALIDMLQDITQE